MKKQILSLLIAFLGNFALAHAQVGISTSNPQGSFNVDGAKDNPATGIPNATQQSNDFILLNTGNVGLGTVVPIVKLDMIGTTFGIRNSQASGSWDNLWFNVTPSIPSINASGAESGLQFNVGSNSVGTYGDGQTLATVATMLATGNMGVGTTTPNHRLDLGTSLGSSVTDVAGKKLALYDAAGGGDFYGLGINSGVLQFHSASTVAEAPGMVLTSAGNVGIANTAPTNTLDVAGTTRVRTITPVTGATVVTPVYSDANGVLVKASPSAVYGGVTSNNSANIASGSTGTLVTGIVDGGMYKIVVAVGDACADFSIAELYVNNSSANNYFAINGLGGILSSGSTNKSPTFTQINRTTIAITWTGKVGCSGGDNASSFNYTLALPSAGTINVTNNGNITKAYSITLTRIY